jgi:hypothetical protein
MNCYYPVQELCDARKTLYKDVSRFDAFISSEEYENLSTQGKLLIKLGRASVLDRIEDVSRNINFLIALQSKRRHDR